MAAVATDTAVDASIRQAELLATLGVALSGESKASSQKDHGQIGGLVAGRLGSNKYVVRRPSPKTAT